jgi:hypothetical protein
VLGNALPAAQKLHIVCSRPEHLDKLFMLEDAESVGVGQCCTESGLFNNAESVEDEEKDPRTSSLRPLGHCY